LSPRTKEDVPIKNETTVRRFCVPAVIMVELVLAFSCCSANTNERSIPFSTIIKSNTIAIGKPFDIV
jgi:hypothetical protein